MVDEASTGSDRETLELGRRIAEELEGGEIIALIGELGAGKTVLTKGIALGLGIADAERTVTSPTFILHRRHDGGRLVLHHVDAYRLSDGVGFIELGLLEELDGSAVLVIEWADRVGDALPAPQLVVELSHAGENAREIRIRR